MSELNVLTRQFLLQAVRTCAQQQQDALFIQQLQQAITQARRAHVTRQLLHGVEADSLALRPIPSSESDSSEDAFSSSGASSSKFVPLFLMPASIDFHKYWQCRLSLSIVSGISANLDALYKESTTAPDASNMPNALIDRHFHDSSSLVSSDRHSLALNQDMFREVNFDERGSNCEYHHAVITVIPFSTVQHAHAVHAPSTSSSAANPFDAASLPTYLLGGRPGRLLLTYASNRLFAEEEVERLLLRVECPEYVHIDASTGEEQILPAIYVTLSSYKRFVLSDRKPKSTHRLNHLHQFLKTVRIPSSLFFHFLTMLIQAREMSLSKTAERHLQEMRVQYEFTYEGGPAPNLKSMSSSRRKADSDESDQSDQPRKKKTQKKRKSRKGASRFIDDEAEEESDEDDDGDEESGSHEDHEDEEGEDEEQEDDEDDSEMDGFVVDDDAELIMDSSAEPSEESDASARRRKKGKEKQKTTQKAAAQQPPRPAADNAGGKRPTKLSHEDNEEHKSNVKHREDASMEESAAAADDVHMSEDEDDAGPAPSPSSNRKRKRILDDEDEEDEHHHEAEAKNAATSKSPKLGAMKSPKLPPAASSPALKPHDVKKDTPKKQQHQAEPVPRERSPVVKSEPAPANKKAKLSAPAPQPPVRSDSLSSASSSSSSDSSSSDAAPAPTPTNVTVKSESKKPIASLTSTKVGKPISSPAIAPPKPIQAPGRIMTPAKISKPASPALRAAAVSSSAENRAKLSGLFDEDADFAPKPVVAAFTAARPQMSKARTISSSDDSSSDSDSDSNKSIDMTKPPQKNKGNAPSKFQPSHKPSHKHKNKSMK